MRNVQPLFRPAFNRLAFSMLPPVTLKSPFWTVRKLKVAGSALRWKRMSNAAVPSCSAGTRENDAVNGTPGTVAETASPSGLPPAQTAFVSVHARAGMRPA